MYLKTIASFLNRFCKGLLTLWLWVALPSRYTTNSHAQERYQINYPSWTKADTTEILQQIKLGYRLMFRNRDSAMIAINNAIEKSLETGFDDGIGYALSYKGLIQVNSGLYQEGFATFQKALHYCLKAQYLTQALPGLYINMGASYRISGDYERANSYYFKALQLLQRNQPDDVNILVVYSNLAGVQSSLGNHRLALEYAKKTEALSIEKQNKNTLASAKMNIGALYHILQQADSAIVYLQDALVLAKELDHRDKEQNILANLGEHYLTTGRLDLAAQHFTKAVKIGKEAHNLLRGTIMPGYGLARVYLSQQRYLEAEHILNETETIASTAGIMEGRTEAIKTKIDLLKATGRYKEALEQTELLKSLEDSLTSIEKIRTVNELDQKYKGWQKDRTIAEHALKLTIQQKQLERNKWAFLSLALALIFTATAIYFYARHKRKAAKKAKEIALLKANIDGEEKERQRLARELHDGVGGLLTSARFNLNRIQENSSWNKDELRSMSELLNEISNEVQRTAHNLMPDVIQEHDLWQALWAYTEQITDTLNHIQIDLQTAGNTRDLHPDASLSLYRITQELIQNAIKHSKASRLAIQSRRDGENQKLFLSIEDNGVGFDTSASFYGLGLKNIKERIKLLNGFFSIDSNPVEGGTIALIDIDLKYILKS
jgi:signal transduction histidine kinase